MSNVNDVNKRSTQTPQQHQSVGLAAYWKLMRCEVAEETNHPSGTEKLGYVAKDGALTERLEGSSKSIKGVKMIQTENFDGQDADVGVGVARSVKHCKSGIQNSPLFPSTSAAKGITSECHFAGEGASNDPTKWMRALSFGKDIHFGSNPFLNTTPHIVENGGKLVVDKGKAAVSAVPTPSQTGSNSAASNKAFNVESNTPARSNVGFSGKVGHMQPSNKLPPLPGAATSSDKSREAEKLLQHGKLPDLPNADPGNRSLKRLKLNYSTLSAQGTTCSNVASPSSLKISKLYGGIPRSCKTSSATNPPEKQHGKKPVWLDERGDLWNKGEEHIMENPKEKRRAFLLSHAWIKRWLPNEQGTTETLPEAEASRDPQSSKLSAEKLQEKKFPSIEAMAQMGRV